MGFYLNGKHGDQPPLPTKQKAGALIRFYGAQELSRTEYEHLRGFDCWPTGMRLVIVIEQHYFDAALVVDKKEWDYLREFPGELKDSPRRRFFFVPQASVDGLISGAGKPDWGDVSSDVASA